MADVKQGLVPRDEELGYDGAAKECAAAKANFDAAVAELLNYAKKMPELIKQGEDMANADAMKPIAPAWSKFAETVLSAEKELTAFGEQVTLAGAAFRAMGR